MKIKSVLVENLFELFTYEIDFKRVENVLMITGPNGFGKTMILNIIFNLFNRKYSFFRNLIFRKITVNLESDLSFVISKNPQDSKRSLVINLLKGGTRIETLNYSQDADREMTDHIEMYISRYAPLHRISTNRWMDIRNNKEVDAEEIWDYLDAVPEEVRKRFERPKSKKIDEILGKIKVHLIKEQRLFKKIPNPERSDHYGIRSDHNVMSETIKVYSDELKEYITQFSEKSFAQTQELDSSYPARLRGETNILSEEEYGDRYASLKERQKKLRKFGLYDSKQEFLTYTSEDAKALSVYLKDLEKKLGVFDELLNKLELFTDILNDRRFTFKSIRINREKGFYFETSSGKYLELSQLSSGEQHEVVLLYELIFNVSENVLVLIDEPEISLHVTWQKEFLNDLLRIVKLQNIQVVIATHSPAIINGRWDLVYNLEKEN